jgi:dTDP-4-dehydrorhamnose 3,5-epimerase-like enzyme
MSRGFPITTRAYVVPANHYGVNVFVDKRGTLVCNLDPCYSGNTVGQVNVSINKRSVFRGMHAHENQTDVWIPDQRLMTVTAPIVPTGKPVLDVRVIKPGEALVIPPGTLHGFLTTRPTVLTYMTDQFYDPADEFQLHHSELGIGLDPGVALSARDKDGKFTLEHLREMWYNGAEGDR